MPANLAKKIAVAKDEYYQVHHSFAFYPDAIPTVELIRTGGAKTALVTGAKRERIMSTVDKATLKLFDTVVTGDDVTHGKPSPEPYLLAAKKLGKSPNQCLVVENAPLGVKSAKAAGMKCLAIGSTLPKDELPGLDYYLNSIREFFLLVQNI